MYSEKMMKLIRKILRPFVFLVEYLLSPKAVNRSFEEQLKINEKTKNMELFQFEACPFCVKVRLAEKRLGINLKKRDVLNEKMAEEELLKGGGQRQVPCLRIKNEDGTSKWIYESSDIVTFMDRQFT